MPVTNADTYNKLKITINSKDGSITESYALANTVVSPTPLIPICMNIVALRGQLLAKGAAEVAATLSVESFADNKADGVAWPAYWLYAGTLQTKINNSTAETVIEGYSDPSQGVRVDLPTVNGRVEQRLLRFVRASWILQNSFMVTNFAPMDPTTYNAAIAAGFNGQPPWKLFSAFFSYIRDNTVLVRRAATNFELSTFSSGGSDWSVSGISKRGVGYGWPKVQGRQRNFS